MNTDQVRDILLQTLADDRLSRGEGQALRQLVESQHNPQQTARQIAKLAFQIAREKATDRHHDELILWLERVTRALTTEATTNQTMAEVVFSPGDDCLQRLVGLIRSSRRRIDICVFTISDDRISRELLAAKRNGVGVRIISDDAKSGDRGSDINRLASAGIAVRCDRSEAHMHHKFAIFDQQFAVTGSYNWTRSAAEYNWENLIIMNDTSVVATLEKEFERLWEELA